MSELQAKTGLFIEYLRHERGVTYTEMAKRTGMAIAPIGKHELSAKRCYKLCMAFREYVDDFDRYYGWRVAS